MRMCLIALGVIALLVPNMGLAQTTDREAEAKRLFVEAYNVTQSGPCEKAPKINYKDFKTLFELLNNIELLPFLLECLKHTKKAVPLQQKILTEFPDTEAAYQLAIQGVMNEGQIDTVIGVISVLLKDFGVIPDKTLLAGINRRELVKKIQTYLGKKGLYTGGIDGIAGPSTRKAIREYQAANDLKITGEPSWQLERHLRGWSTN